MPLEPSNFQQLTAAAPQLIQWIGTGTLDEASVCSLKVEYIMTISEMRSFPDMRSATNISARIRLAMESQSGEGMRNNLTPTDRLQNFFSGGHVLVIRSVTFESWLVFQGDLKAPDSVQAGQ
jgi:hypothetical protein